MPPTPTPLRPLTPEFELLRFGEILPRGWIREQMARDLAEGFAGHMPEIAPKTCASEIFGAQRNLPDRFQNAGGGSWGGATGAWWNGETEGNWRSGNTMMCLLAGTPAQRAALDARIAELLKTQDTDGYMGIYGPSLRWADGNVINGELWTQTCLFRGLIAYAEATGRADVLHAVERAVQLAMSHYGEGRKSPFGAATMEHNLMFVDVVERLHEITGNPAYRDFGVYLYLEFSKQVKADVALPVLLAADRALNGHGATTYEALRVPLWAAYVTGDPVLVAAAAQAFRKAWIHVSPTGGPVSNEMIASKPTDPDLGGYEGCAQKEWMHSLLSAAQKTGRTDLAEQAATTFYNCAQGSRLPDGKGVDYVTTDNIYKIDGAIMNRVIFSPAHEDVANCCAPNFTQIGPVFVRHMWLRAPDGLALMLPGPCELNTVVNGTPVRVVEETTFPFSEQLELRIDPARPVAFVLRVRVPAWATSSSVTAAGATIQRAGDWILLTKTWQAGDVARLAFGADVQPVPANNGEFYVRRGPLLYALPFEAIKEANKNYPLPGFHDYTVSPVRWGQGRLAFPQADGRLSTASFTPVANPQADPRFPWDATPVRLKATMVNLDTHQPEVVELVPMGSGEALLRRMTFPAAR